MTQLPTASQIDDFKQCLVQYYLSNCHMLIRRFSSMGEKSEIQSTINLVLAEIFDRYVRGQPAPENLGGFVHRAVERKLIDAIRADRIPIEDLDLEDVDLEDVDLRAVSEVLNLSMTPEVEAAWTELFRMIFHQLRPRWHEVAKMVMHGASPEEIGRKFSPADADPHFQERASAAEIRKQFAKKGYVLVRYVRKLVCRILGPLANAGDEFASRLARSFCRKSY